MRVPVLTVCVLFAAMDWLSAAEPARPNIVIIMFDDLGYGDLGCQGGTDIPTPRIDSLAANGARCTAAYSNGAFCTPTRAALIGCRYQQRFGVEGLEREDGINHLPLAVNTLPERLRAAGYHTGFVGRWHIGHKPEAQGFGPGPVPHKLASPPKDMRFNLADDPGEERDLAAAHPEEMGKLKKLYEAWSGEVDADAAAWKR